MAQQPSAIYTKEYPPLSELEKFNLQDLQTFARTLEEDVALIEEENRIFSSYLRSQKDKEGAAAAHVEEEEPEDRTQGAAGAAGGGRRRGKAYRRKSSDHKDTFLTLEDKQQIFPTETDRLKLEREKNDRLVEDARDLIRATIEESQTRIKEVKMEMAYFKREIAGDKDVSADKVLKFFADRPAQKESVVHKLKEKCNSLHQQIAKYTNQLRQREDVGEAFHTIDFDQLKIENHQFNERIEQKNMELVELKGTTTRTVQTLNGLTDKLNVMTAEQARLKKELHSRQEHVSKLTLEIASVDKEGATAKKEEHRFEDPARGGQGAKGGGLHRAESGNVRVGEGRTELETESGNRLRARRSDEAADVRRCAKQLGIGTLTATSTALTASASA